MPGKSNAKTRDGVELPTGSPNDCDPKMQKEARFVERGIFNPRSLLWFNPKWGFFWTLSNGMTHGGKTCLSQKFVSEALSNASI